MKVYTGIHSDGEPILVIGLTDEEITDLRNGEKIVKDADGGHIDFHLVVFYGQTDQHLEAIIKAILGKEVLHVNR